MRFIAILSLFISFQVVFVSLAQASQLKFYTHFIRPFTYEEDGKIQGFAVDIVAEMMKIVGQPVEFSMVPFSRGLVAVQHDEDMALFIVARRPEREGTVKWVGPLFTSDVYFYKKRGSKLQLTCFEDLIKVRKISVVRSNADHALLSSLGYGNLALATDHMASLKMLVARRVEVTPMSEFVMPTMAKQAGIDLNEIERTGLKLYSSVLYLVFSLNIPDEIVAEWQDALEQLKENGVYDAIYARWIKGGVGDVPTPDSS